MLMRVLLRRFKSVIFWNTLATDEKIESEDNFHILRLLYIKYHVKKAKLSYMQWKTSYRPVVLCIRLWITPISISLIRFWLQQWWQGKGNKATQIPSMLLPIAVLLTWKGPAASMCRQSVFLRAMFLCRFPNRLFAVHYSKWAYN